MPNPYSTTIACSQCGARGPKATSFSQTTQDGSMVKRTRDCTACGGSFTTYEIHSDELHRLNRFRILVDEAKALILETPNALDLRKKKK